MARRSLGLCAWLIMLVGCASSLPVSTQPAGDPGSASATSAVVEQPPADVARVVCARDAVRLDTHVVRAHANGVSFVFENPGNAWGFEFHPLSFEHGQSQGGRLQGDTMEQLSTLPPGEVTVACLPDARSSYSDPDAMTATFTVVDPDRSYVPWDLVCGWGEHFRITIAGDENEDPAEVFRRVPGVSPSDEFAKPLYPESPLRWPTFIVFRDGEAVAWIGGPGIGESWELFVNACPGSGITAA